ncbi:MAG: putative transport system permease protein [Micromonosporaceae bacterium]|nr:putative transport system permease protein [Micromonosporaceae bacterium]
MAGWTVVLRGIRYRSGRSLVVLLLAGIATAATVLAPAYTRAAQQSVLSDGLRSAPANATSLQVRSDPVAGEAPALESTAEARLELDKLLKPRRLNALLQPPVAGADTETVLTPAAGTDVLARLAYRDNACQHLTMVAGECARQAGEVVVSERSAKTYSITAGQKVNVRGRAATEPSSTRSVTITGIYRPNDASEPYWGRGGYFAAGAPDSESSLPRVDAVFVGDEQDLTLPRGLPSVYLDYRLRTDSVRLDDVARLRTDLAGFETEVNGRQIHLSTSLRGVLDDIGTEASALGRTVPIVAVPLVLVCWFVLFLLVAALTEERSPEVGLAKLRGFSPGQAARFGRAEAMLLVVLAAPLGAVAGLILVEVAARTLLGVGVHVEARWPVLAAAGLSIVASFLAVRLASSRALARPVLALLRRVPERARWRAGIADGAVVALAGASLVAAVSDQTAPLALLAPALLAVVAGILTARALGMWSRLRVRRYARKGRVTGLLAHAQLSRRTLGRRVMLVVTVSVALLSFAATAWDVATQARQNVAADSVGADRVLLVGAANPASLIAAVKAADGGAGAGSGTGTTMPVVRATERYGDGTVELLAVDTERLADVAVWRGHGSTALADLAKQLRPTATAPVTVDSFVTVDANAGGLMGKPRLAALVAVAGQATQTVSLGALANGTRRYRAELPACAAGCRLVGLAITRSAGASDPIGAQLSIDAIGSSAGAVAAGFDNAARWRVNKKRAPSATVKLQPGPALKVDASSTDPGDVVLEYVDSPDVLPVALSGPTPNDNLTANEFTFPGLGEVPQSFSVVRRDHALPRAGNNAVLFDLDYAVRAAQRTAGLSDNSRLRYEVWATNNAPADLSSRLASAGLQILGEQSITAERDRLARGAPALGLSLYLIAGGAAVALAVGAVLLTAYIGAQTRRYELAALRVAGIRPWVLRRGLLREYLHLIGVPFVVGLLAGIAGAVLMLPGIPLVTVGTATGEITYTPSLGALPMAIGATLVGLFFAILVVLRLVRTATPDRLREGTAA